MSKDQFIARVEATGELCFFFDLQGGIEKPRVILLQQAFTAFNLANQPYEDEKILYSICYGYSGGGAQSDYLFKHNHVDGAIYYSDSSGDEWKGARAYSKESPFETNVDKDLTWMDYDSEAYSQLMSNWDKYLEEHENGDDITLRADYLALLKNGLAQSDNFDHDCLWNFSGIWNLLTSYR
jgi:hypothetical protein